MSSNLVSIIIPCYNQGVFLDETLLSVYNQSYSNWECIIVDDGSTDNSEFIAKKWVNKDSRFQYYFKQNKGVSSARNFGLAHIKGNFIQFLDADDILHINKLELSLAFIEKNAESNIDIVISNFRMLSVDSKKSMPPFCKLTKDLLTFDNILYKWNESFSIPIHCGFFAASIFKSIRFPEHLTAQEDWLVWVNVFKNENKVAFIDKPLVFYRENLESRTNTYSLHDDQIKVFEALKEILSEEEFFTLSKVLISRYYKIQEVIKRRLRKTKNSNTYQAGLMIKKVLKAMGLLKIAKKLFPLVLKLKSK